MECAGKCSTGKREHGPADTDAHQQKEKKRPEDVLHAVLGAAASQKSEGHGNDDGEEKECLKVRDLERGNGGHALRPRAAS